LRPADLGRGDLRGPPVDGASSRVAAFPGVRAALLAFQRDFARARGAVLDGRDIGTVIFPDAPVKLFVTASIAERARRRTSELRERGVAADRDVVTEEMRRRDAADAGRDTAPMQPAADAILLDTTALDADAAFAHAQALIERRLAQPDKTK
jgi:cytidylate kinase